MEKIKLILNKTFPYVLMFVFSAFACYLLFMTSGYPNGDDSDYHFANIYDQYVALLEGNSSPISPYLASGVGVGKQLFYSPIPHLVIAIVGINLSVFNVSLLTSFKFVLLLSVFISGIFMYHFAMHISKNRKIISLIAAAIFILYPYRLFDYYCRIAIAEGFAIMFLPLFYMGLYDVLNNKDDRVLPYIEVILGAVLLFLSHNLTALYCFIFGIIYLLFNIKKVIEILKNKTQTIYAVISVGLILGLALYNIVTQMTLMNMDFYNVSEPIRMWTNVEAVRKRTYDCACYSGFINIPYISGYYGNILSFDKIVTSLVMFIFYSGITISLDISLSSVKKLKYFHSAIALIIYFGLILLTINRIDIILGAIIFASLYLAIRYIKEEQNPENYHHSVDFWYYIVILVVVLLMITQDWVWDIVPSFLLKIQFPWRLWAFVALYASILAVYIINSFKEKTAKYAAAAVAGFIMVANQPLLEKRLILQYTENPSYRYEINEEVYDKFMSIGANLEYYPKYFHLWDNYKAKYSNSLFNNIYHEIWYSFNQNPYSFEPVFLEGNGSIDVINKKAPVYEMNIRVEEDALIQVPLLYYPGYDIVINGNKTIKVEEVDGLVAFRLEEGEYSIKTNYTGTTLMNIAKCTRYLSYSGLFIFLVFGLNNKKKYYKDLF